MGFIGLYLWIGLLVAVGAFFLLPRGLCLVLGATGLLLGVAAPLTIWSYANLFVTGDPSAYGMLGTLMAVLFAPGGIALTVLGLLKAE